MTLLAILMLCPGMADDVRYTRLSPAAYDLASIITKDEFTENQLVARFRDFARLHATRHKLSRLSVALETESLSTALPEMGLRQTGWSYLNPVSFNGSLNRSISVAQVLCLNGSATAFIKYGESVRKVQVLGNKDPREFFIEGIRVYLVTFAIHAQSRGLDHLVIYAESQPLPSVAQARAFQAALIAAVGTESVAVMVRSDPMFWGMYGDIFQIPFPDISREKYMSTPYVNCDVPMLKRRGHEICEVSVPKDEKTR